MPKTLTDDPTVFPAVAVPIDGEPRVATAWETPYQQLANRTANAKTRIDYLDPTRTGARRMRSVASLAALAALPNTDYSDGELARVRRFGLYEFEALATDATDGRLIVRPADIASDLMAGRWVHEHAATLGRAYWAAQLNSGGKIATANVDTSDLILVMRAAGFVDDVTALSASVSASVTGSLRNQTTRILDAFASPTPWTISNAGAAQDAPSGFVSEVPVNANDLVEVDWWATIEADTATRYLDAQIYASDRGGSFAPTALGFPVKVDPSYGAIATHMDVHVGAIFTVPTGAFYAKLCPKLTPSGAGTTFTIRGSAYMRVRVVKQP